MKLLLFSLLLLCCCVQQGQAAKSRQIHTFLRLSRYFSRFVIYGPSVRVARKTLYFSYGLVLRAFRFSGHGKIPKSSASTALDDHILMLDSIKALGRRNIINAASNDVVKGAIIEGMANNTNTSDALLSYDADTEITITDRNQLRYDNQVTLRRILNVSESMKLIAYQIELNEVFLGGLANGDTQSAMLTAADSVMLLWLLSLIGEDCPDACDWFLMKCDYNNFTASYADDDVKVILKKMKPKVKNLDIDGCLAGTQVLRTKVLAPWKSCFFQSFSPANSLPAIDTDNKCGGFKPSTLSADPACDADEDFEFGYMRRLCPCVIPTDEKN